MAAGKTPDHRAVAGASKIRRYGGRLLGLLAPAGKRGALSGRGSRECAPTNLTAFVTAFAGCPRVAGRKISARVQFSTGTPGSCYADGSAVPSPRWQSLPSTPRTVESRQALSQTRATWMWVRRNTSAARPSRPPAGEYQIASVRPAHLAQREHKQDRVRFCTATGHTSAAVTASPGIDPGRAPGRSLPIERARRAALRRPPSATRGGLTKPLVAAYPEGRGLLRVASRRSPELLEAAAA